MPKVHQKEGSLGNCQGNDEHAICCSGGQSRKQQHWQTNCNAATKCRVCMMYATGKAASGASTADQTIGLPNVRRRCSMLCTDVLASHQSLSHAIIFQHDHFTLYASSTCCARRYPHIPRNLDAHNWYGFCTGWNECMARSVFPHDWSCNCQATQIIRPNMAC